MVLVDQGFEELPAQVGQSPKRAGLVGTHKGCVACHIGGQNGGKSAFHATSLQAWRLTTREKRIYAVGMAWA